MRLSAALLVIGLALPAADGQVSFGVLPQYCSLDGVTPRKYSYIAEAPHVSEWSFSTATGWSNPISTAENVSYSVEGVEYVTGSGCFVCEYSDSHAPSPYWAAIAPGGSPGASPLLHESEHAVMYGPCFDGQPSKPMTCMQHPALWPHDILGEYYYPPQRAYDQPTDTDPTGQMRGFAIHPLIADTPPFNSTPTAYGLGRSRVLADLATFRIVSLVDSTVNVELTSQFIAPFAGDNWPKWAQLHCSAGCHRDAMYTQRIFLPNDPLYTQPKYWALGRLQTGDITNPTLAVSCRKCPPGTAVYSRTIEHIGGAPYNVFSAAYVMGCRPWFGALPTVIPNLAGDSWMMAGRLDSFGSAENIVNPSQLAVFDTTPCPVNTYNRVCADAWLLRYILDQSDTPTCAPCSGVGVGWHTGGAVGAWFCLPPPGLVFANRGLLRADEAGPYWANGTQWRRRDLWRFELECGLAPQCQQCQAVGAPQMSPDSFNEAYIFTPFLQTGVCPANSYCPDGVTQTACDSTRPVSPPGSTSILNCTCAAGRYLSNGACVSCTSSCAVPGTYLPRSLCMEVLYSPLFGPTHRPSDAP